jgi:hypothetical protein
MDLWVGVKSKLATNNLGHAAWIKVFVVGNPRATYDVEIKEHKGAEQTQLHPDVHLAKEDLDGKEFVGFWWYAEDDTSPHQSLMTLKGGAYISIQQLIGQPPRRAVSHDMTLMKREAQLLDLDNDRAVVGHVEVTTAVSAAIMPGRISEQSLAAAVEIVHERYLRELETFMEKTYPLKKQLQILELGMPSASNLAPVLAPCFAAPYPLKVSLPDWAFSVPTLQTPEPEGAKDYFLYLLQVAMIRLGLGGIEALHEDELLELGCEIVIMPSLAMRYRTDHQDDRSTDEWTYLSHFPTWKRASLDCEDAAEHTLRMTHFLSQIDVGQNPAPPSLLERVLSRVQQAMRKMRFCMCLGTLEVQNKAHVWHSFIMGFEADWFERVRTGQTVADDYRPKTVLLESTCYLTSNMRYRPRRTDVDLLPGAADKYDFGVPDDWCEGSPDIKDSTDGCPVPLCRKLGVDELAKQFHYKHLALALVPEEGFLAFCYANSRILGVCTESLVCPPGLTRPHRSPQFQQLAHTGKVLFTQTLKKSEGLDQAIQIVQSFLPPPKFPFIDNVSRKIQDLEDSIKDLRPWSKQTVYCTVGPATDEQLNDTLTYLQQHVTGSNTAVKRMSAEIGFGAFVHLFLVHSF